MASPTDVIEATDLDDEEPYPFPGNHNITLKDLPGIGTKTYPDLDTYCEKVGLEQYDTFLILTATRFTRLEFELAKKIQLMEKSFFLIRTKIDIDEMNDKRKTSHDIEEMLGKIRVYCYESVKDLKIRKEDIFLISNVKKYEQSWDYVKLVETILSTLDARQKEALTLELKTFSRKILESKIEIFKGELPLIVLLYALAVPIDLITFGFASYCIDWVEIKRRTKSYRSSLGLPEEDSDEFKQLKPEFQDRLKNICPYEKFWLSLRDRVKEKGPGIIFTVRFYTRETLVKVLEEMKALCLDIFDDFAAKANEELKK